MRADVKPFDPIRRKSPLELLSISSEIEPTIVASPGVAVVASNVQQPIGTGSASSSPPRESWLPFSSEFVPGKAQSGTRYIALPGITTRQWEDLREKVSPSRSHYSLSVAEQAYVFYSSTSTVPPCTRPVSLTAMA